MRSIAQYSAYLVILVALALPLGRYISKVMEGERVFLSPICEPCERGIYALLGIRNTDEMGWKKYAKCVIALSGLGLVALMALLMLQHLLPLNPEHMRGFNFALAFNTAASFVTNTNWQAYAGERSVSYLTQTLGLTVQNFISAAMGISVLFALIRGLNRTQKKTIGSFWVDMTRSIVYILVPLALVLALALVSQGVAQNFKPYEKAPLLETYTTPQGTTISQRIIPQGPMASQVAIKQLGTNGGGYNGTNSASPLENPTIVSNLLEVLSILLIPMALCFAFGRSVHNPKQGRVLFAAMFIVLVLALAGLGAAEQAGTPQLHQKGAISTASITHGAEQAGGNMEGKETRFGIASSALWSTFTTAASNGSVNSMLDSYTPFGAFVMLVLMQLGEVIFGGVGSGLYGMLGFVIFTVFLAGLMVGRTPEFLGKKIGPREMRLATIICLTTPVIILIGSGVAALVPHVALSLHNSGAHGFTELLYAFTSAGANNGSSFAGFNANTTFLNLTLGVVMLIARYVPLLATLALAGSFVAKKKNALTAGTLVTTNTLFVVLLVIVVFLVGALSFFPALSLGPLAEHFQSAQSVQNSQGAPRAQSIQSTRK